MKPGLKNKHTKMKGSLRHEHKPARQMCLQRQEAWKTESADHRQLLQETGRLEEKSKRGERKVRVLKAQWAELGKPAGCRVPS
jgi:predicted nuclease with TOPRIM domain